MAILSKGCKPDKFESHNSLKLSFTNSRGLHSNFVEYESFFESNFPGILALCGTNLEDSTDSGNISVTGYLPLFEGRTSFCLELISKKLSGFLFILSTGFTPFSFLLLFPLSITFFVLMHCF